jgi:hypothetical protein
VVLPDLMPERLKWSDVASKIVVSGKITGNVIDVRVFFVGLSKFWPAPIPTRVNVKEPLRARSSSSPTSAAPAAQANQR